MSQKFSENLVATPDTDVFVNLVYQFIRWIYADLEQLGMIFSKKGSENVIPIHVVGERLDDSIIESLPGAHALSGQ